MPEIRICASCGTEIPSTFPEGLCPKCMLQAGFESRPPVDPADMPTQRSPVASSGFVPPDPAELAARFPHLEILELLGKGGMGAVYKARQPGLDRLVAVKILPPDVSHDPAFAERFTREARALARLSHPNIVAVHDFGQADGLYYFVMEYVDGANLRQAIHVGGMTPKDALAVVPQICDALQFAHEEGIVHRDIKPENILIDKRGRVKIADFGLAKLLGQDQTDHALTATHQVMGTLRYMAPEQMEGSKQVDHRADIYSLGVVFYELLTGELPIGRFAAPSKKVQIDVRLDEIVLRALEKEPERRYQHASEVRTEMESLRQHPSLTPVPAQAVAPDHVVRRRLTVIYLVLAALATTLFCGLTAGYLAGANWYFQKELPYQYLNSALNAVSLGCMVLLTYWWYLLAKNPQTPRSVYDFFRVLQTPDPRARKLWLPMGLFLGGSGVSIALAFTLTDRDAIHTVVSSAPIVLGPFLLMAVLWRVYRPTIEADSARPEMGIERTKETVVPEQRIQWPAVCQIVVAAIGVAFWLPVSIWAWSPHNLSGSPIEGLIRTAALLLLAASAVTLAGAIAMLRVQSHGLAAAGAIASLIPTHIGWLLGMPAGIQALRVLSRDDVRELFRRRRQEREAARKELADGRASAGSPDVDPAGPHFVGALAAAIAATGLGLWFLGRFAGLFIDSLRGFDGPFVERGKAWGIGSTTESVQLSVALMTVVLTGATVAAWVVWLHRRAIWYAARTREARTKAEILTRGPAIGLIAMGLCGLPFALLVAVLLFGKQYFGDEPFRWTPWIAVPGILYWGLDFVWMIQGGLKLLALESHSKVRQTAGYSLSPHVNLFAFAPISLWAWLILHREDVKTAFPSERDDEAERIDLVPQPVHATLPPAPLPQLLAVAIGLVLGMLCATVGLLLIPAGFLLSEIGSGPFWGWMGVAFGCLAGGLGSLVGSWNTYRQLRGQTDWMRMPHWTGFDFTMFLYGALGLAFLAAPPVLYFSRMLGTADSAMARATFHGAWLLGALITFQSLLFFLWRFPLVRAHGRARVPSHACGAAVLVACLSTAAVSAALLLPGRPVPIFYTYYGDTGFVAGPEGPMLGDALAGKMGIPAAQRREADRIFQRYYGEFLSLERSHTKHTRDPQGHIHITIEPFPDDSLALVRRMSAELGGVVDQHVAPRVPEKGRIHAQLGLFRHAGEATITAELWKDRNSAAGHTYMMKENLQWIDGSNSGSRGSSGPTPDAFPEEYRLFWIEPAASPARESRTELESSSQP